MILEGPIRLTFTYAAGEIGSRFLVALRDERVILAGVCSQCARVACPPRSFCTACGTAVKDFVEVGPEGTLEAWTAQPGKGVFGLIRLDGADTPLVHRLLGNWWQKGARVRARFAEDRTANITDIEGFEPEEEAS
ncbi:MAG: Zn-ribbon domain-containing OB-fold protein [Acidimicrobiia bacterium]